MLRAAIIFFSIGLIAILIGANNLAGFSMEAGKITLVVFLVLALLSAFVGIFTGRRSKIMP